MCIQIGLAVGDIQKVEENATLTYLGLQVNNLKVIYHMLPVTQYVIQAHAHAHAHAHTHVHTHTHAPKHTNCTHMYKQSFSGPIVSTVLCTY